VGVAGIRVRTMDNVDYPMPSMCWSAKTVIRPGWPQELTLGRGTPCYDVSVLSPAGRPGQPVGPAVAVGRGRSFAGGSVRGGGAAAGLIVDRQSAVSVQGRISRRQASTLSQGCQTNPAWHHRAVPCWISVLVAVADNGISGTSDLRRETVAEEAGRPQFSAAGEVGADRRSRTPGLRHDSGPAMHSGLRPEGGDDSPPWLCRRPDRRLWRGTAGGC
jgi:hypothetical protein